MAINRRQVPVPEEVYNPYAFGKSMGESFLTSLVEEIKQRKLNKAKQEERTYNEKVKRQEQAYGLTKEMAGSRLYGPVSGDISAGDLLDNPEQQKFRRRPDTDTEQPIYKLDKNTGELIATGKTFMGKKPIIEGFGFAPKSPSGTGANAEINAIDKATDNARQFATAYYQQVLNDPAFLKWQGKKPEHKGKIQELVNDIAMVESYDRFGIPLPERQSVVQRIGRNNVYLKSAGMPQIGMIEKINAIINKPVNSQNTTNSMSLETRASDFLKANNAPDTPANRKAIIDKGLVK